jgi:hypothetical protein
MRTLGAPLRRIGYPMNGRLRYSVNQLTRLARGRFGQKRFLLHNAPLSCGGQIGSSHSPYVECWGGVSSRIARCSAVGIAGVILAVA